MHIPNAEQAVVDIRKLREYCLSMTHPRGKHKADEIMDATIEVLDVVALMEDLPQRLLDRGQVGTVVERLAPDVFEVEFSDNTGRAYAMLALRVEQMLVVL